MIKNSPELQKHAERLDLLIKAVDIKVLDSNASQDLGKERGTFSKVSDFCQDLLKSPDMHIDQDVFLKMLKTLQTDCASIIYTFYVKGDALKSTIEESEDWRHTTSAQVQSVVLRIGRIKKQILGISAVPDNLQPSPP